MTTTFKPAIAGTHSVLVVSKNTSRPGGVVKFIQSLIMNLSDQFAPSHFTIGSSSPREISSSPFRVLLDTFRFAYTLSRHNWHCVHLNPSLTLRSLVRDGLLLFLAKKCGSQNILVFFHGWEWPLFKKIKQKRLLRKVFVHILDYATTIAVLGTSFKTELESLGIIPQKVVVLTTMFDGTQISSKERKPTVDDTMKILFLGRLVREKGIYELLEAFLLAKDRGLDLRLTIAGVGPELQTMQQWIVRNRLKESVEFLGYVEAQQKNEAFANSDVYILPSYSEGCPVSLIEAMASGMPIISTRVGCIPDLIEDKKNGILLKDHEAESIYSALEFLKTNPELRAEMSSKNIAQSWTNYESKAITRQIERLYEAETINQEG